MSLDFTDRAAVRQWLAGLRVAIDDAAGITEDLLRPVRQRDLGQREHERLYTEAAQKIAHLMDYASAPPSERTAAP